MEVTRTAQNAAERFDESVWSRNQYLETARGHYLSALAVRTSEKEAEDNAFKQAAEVQQASTSGQQGQIMTFAEVDAQIQMPHRAIQASEKDLKAVKSQLDKALGRNTISQVTGMVCKLGSLGREVDIIDALSRNFARKVSSKSDNVNELLSNTVVDSGSLYKVVESLKAQLETLKKEHADIKDIDAGADHSSRDMQMRLLKCNCENEGCIGRRGKAKQVSEEVIQNKVEVNDLNSKTKGLKREHDAAKFSAKVEKRRRTVFDVEKPKDGSARALDQAKNSPEGSYPTCVSTSESTARVLISEDEHESSIQQVGKQDKAERGTLTAAMGGVEGDKCDYSSEFSIRNFVYAARNKDISMSWPFSRDNLQRCLKHGVKDVLPPFQPIDSLRESTMKRCLEQKILHSEESNHDGMSSVLKNSLGPSTRLDGDHSWNEEPGEDYRDSNSSPTEGERNMAFKTIAIANSQSEVESVSTSNLLSPEVSDEREAAASAVASNKAKSSASQLSNKKCKMAVKMQLGSKHNAPEDITSACTIPPETISSKICPVCENYSSSSNTTLNAHIDQCLSSQSPPTWLKNCKLSKSRIKPRKMRLMTDICATAPCCTLEDLDKRNGTNWATNVDFPLEDADMPSQLETPRVSSRYIINSINDGSVYIDSSGTKIRILSKLNDTSPSSSLKTSDQLKLKKKSINGKRSKLFSSNRKKRLSKHRKYFNVAHRKNQFSSLKVKACTTEEAVHKVGNEHKNQEQPASFVKRRKAQGQNHSVVGTTNRSTSIKISNVLKKNGSKAITNISGCEVQATPESLVGNDQVEIAQVGLGRTIKYLNSPVRSVTSMHNNFTSTHPSGVDERSNGSRRGKTLSGPSLRCAIRGNKETFKVSVKLGEAKLDEGITKKSTPNSSNSTTNSSPLLERETDVQPISLQDADTSFTASRKLVCGSHVGPSEKLGLHKSKTKTAEPNNSRALVPHSNSDQMNLVSCDCNREKERETCLTEASQQPGAIMNLPKSSRITDSLGRSSLAKVRQRPVQEHGCNGLKYIKRSNTSDDNHDYGDRHISAIKGLHGDGESIDPVSTSSLAIVYEAELENGADMSSQSQLLQCSKKFQGPLYGGAETRVKFGHLAQSNERGLFFGNMAEAENMSLREGEYVFNFGIGNIFAEVDPIPIPGPPGSDLPSFSDMSSDDLHKGSQRCTLAQPSGHGDDDISDSPLSPTSLSASVSIPDNVYAEGLDTNPGSMPGISAVASQSTSVERERFGNSCVNNLENGVINLSGSSAMLSHDNHQSWFSHQEGIIWMNSQESQLSRQRSTSLESFSEVIHTNSTLNAESNVPDDRQVFSSGSYHISESSLETNRDAVDPFSRMSDYDSACPSAPILRLMGKDLMVSNSMETDLSRFRASVDGGVNGLVLPVGKTSSQLKSWKPSSEYSVFMGALHHGQDPHLLSGQHLDARQLNVLPCFGTHNQASGSVYVDEPMHASFSSCLAAAPLYR